MNQEPKYLEKVDGVWTAAQQETENALTMLDKMQWGTFRVFGTNTSWLVAIRGKNEAPRIYVLREATGDFFSATHLDVIPDSVTGEIVILFSEGSRDDNCTTLRQLRVRNVNSARILEED